MTKKKYVTPSRKKYDDNNPTSSFRLPKQLKEQLEKHLATSGQTPRQFIESILKGEQALINQRVNARVEQLFGAFKKRVDLIDDLVYQMLFTLRENNLSALCPRCKDKGDYRLFEVLSYQPGPNGRPEEFPTWKCPHCGWFYDIQGHIKPAYLQWDDPVSALREGRRKPNE